MTLELTTTFRGISTAGGKSPGSAAGLAAAHLRYIDRDGAVEDRASSGFADLAPEQQRDALRKRFRNRSEKGGKNGARVAERFIVSLPNGWPREARQDALQRLCEHIAPPGSEAVAYGVTHNDKPGNAHLHILAQDGAESRSAALLRRPDAKRVRRQNVIRLGEKTRAKEMRSEIADILNEIAAERGIEGVEWRSFEDRGISRKPGRHEGPTRRAQEARERSVEVSKWLDSGIVEKDNFLDDLTPPRSASRHSISAPQRAVEPKRDAEGARREGEAQQRAERVRQAALRLKAHSDALKHPRKRKRGNFER